MNTQIKEKLKSNKQRLFCDRCNRSYGNLSNLRRHRKLHHTERVAIYTCQECGSEFKRKDDGRKHNRKFHPEKNPEPIFKEYRPVTYTEEAKPKFDLSKTPKFNLIQGNYRLMKEKEKLQKMIQEFATPPPLIENHFQEEDMKFQELLQELFVSDTDSDTDLEDETEERNEKNILVHGIYGIFRSTSHKELFSFLNC